MRIRTLWFTFFVMLMLLLPPLFARRDAAGASTDEQDSRESADLPVAVDSR